MEKQYKSTTHEERFIHLKAPALFGSHKYHGATIFARKEDDGLWYLAIAMCWKADQFDRSRGRKNARRNYFRAMRNNACLGLEWNYDMALDYAAARVQISSGIAL